MRLRAAQSPAASADALQQQRGQFIANFRRIGLNTAPEDAQFLRMMVEIAGVKRGVEVGTATGHGAIHMGLAFEANGGELITVDIDPKMVATARENIGKMKLEQTVSVIEGDALKVLPKLQGKFDFVFIDAVKRDYLQYFKDLEPLLEPGADHRRQCDSIRQRHARFPDDRPPESELPDGDHPRFGTERRRHGHHPQAEVIGGGQ